MKFEEWFKGNFPNNTDPSFKSDMKDAWETGYDEGYEEALDISDIQDSINATRE